jgi:hypothetical protein
MEFVVDPELPVSSASVDSQDVVTSLLAVGMQGSYCIDRLETLLADNPHAEAQAVAQVRDAISLITHARACLLRNADELARLDIRARDDPDAATLAR